MKIYVEHSVSDDPVYCSEADTGGWRKVCAYHNMRFGHQTKNKNPRCDLFHEWLEKDGFESKRCEKCIAASKK